MLSPLARFCAAAGTAANAASAARAARKRKGPGNRLMVLPVNRPPAAIFHPSPRRPPYNRRTLQRDGGVRPLLVRSRMIDAVNDRLGWVANWLVLAAALISAGNAMSRYAFDLSSNAWLEVQWYLFAAMVMFGASYTLKVNEHVRVDILYTHLSERGKEWLDLVGAALCLVPSLLGIAWCSWQFCMRAWRISEMS